MERVYVFVLQVIRKRLAHSAPDGHTTQTPSTDEKDKFPSCKGRPALPAEERKSIVVTAKFDIDEYQQMMDKAITAYLKKSEYLRHSALHCKVVERLKPKDVKAIRDLQGIAENLNQIARFCNAILRGGINDERVVRTYQDIVDSREFIVSLIKIYRNTPDNV